MKKIKIVLLGVILAVGVLGSYNLVQAAPDTCTSAGYICRTQAQIDAYSGDHTFCEACLSTKDGDDDVLNCSQYSCGKMGVQCCADEDKAKKFENTPTPTPIPTPTPTPTPKPLTQAANSCCVYEDDKGVVNCYEPQDGKCLDGKLEEGLTCAQIKAKGICIKITITPNSSDAIEFKNPIAINSVSGLLDSILNNLMGLIVIIAVIFIIIGGIMYMTSAGNEKMVTRAKQTWTGATVGLAIALASPTFLKQIKIILESNSNTGGSADAWVNKALTIKDIAINVLNFLLSIFGILAIIALVIGGGMYLTAYGDEKKIDSGKKIITYAIIGIVVALSALVVTRQIAGLIGVMAK